MSFQFDGQKCPVCHAYFFEDDDIVCCPECGAPHHRDCYLNIGHCAFEDAHGTERQYHYVPVEEPVKNNIPPQREERDVTKCKMCGEEYESAACSCPKCGAPNFDQMNQFANYDFLGGVPAELDLGDGVTADEAKRFVMTNTTRYIPKFADMKTGRKLSWNWLAFFFPCGWFCSRKMYRNGIFCGLFEIAFSLLMQPSAKLLYGMNAQNQNMTQLALSAFRDHPSVMAFAWVGILLYIFFRVFAALFGDYFYNRHVLSRVGYIKDESEDADYDYHRYGGVSIFGMLLGIFAVQNLPQLIFLLI